MLDCGCVGGVLAVLGGLLLFIVGFALLAAGFGAVFELLNEVGPAFGF